MSQSITLPDDVYSQLEALARPFIDREPVDVIRMLIDSHCGRSDHHPTPTPPPSQSARHEDLDIATQMRGRPSRERGARVKLDEQLIEADSVRDLYGKALRYVAEAGAWDCLADLVPYKTSGKRYLVSTEPVHPTGKSFVMPVEFQGLYMEAHKNYWTALTQLERLLGNCGISVNYIGGRA